MRFVRHLYLHSSLCEGRPAQSNLNVGKHGDDFLAFMSYWEGVDLFPMAARLSMVIVAVNSTAVWVVMRSFFPSQSKTNQIRQPRSRNPFLSLSLSLSISFSLSLSLTALQHCFGNPDSNCTHCLVILLWWSEMNRTRMSVPIKTNSKMKLFQVKLPLRVTKETADSQKN